MQIINIRIKYILYIPKRVGGRTKAARPPFFSACLVI